MGKSLAWAEMRLVVAHLLWNFDIRASDGIKPLEWTSQKIFWAWDKQPVKVRISKARRV